MDKLIVTIAADCTISFPRNPHVIPMNQTDRYIEEYVRAIEAGASIAHIHGVRYLESELQPDGRRTSRLDVEGWRKMQEGILSRCDAIMQFGVAAARLEERVKVMELRPDMMSVIFHPHDECFQPDPEFPANEIYSIHPRTELLEYARLLNHYNIRPEIECFYTGAYWNIEYVRSRVPLPEPLMCTLFFWPGGTWTPATPRALSYMVEYLPKGCVWNLSVMGPEAHWEMLSHAISSGGHVRVGFEDNPYLSPGIFARSNVELVTKIRDLAWSLGRELASPEERREILGLTVSDTTEPASQSLEDSRRVS